jgi:general secretion pathway protein D
MNSFKRDINLNGPIGLNSDTLASTDLSKGFSGFSYAAKDIAGNVKALLQTLASEDKVTVLASPHIMAADNLEARIQIGSQVPIATSQMTAVGSSNSILSTIQYKDIGTILKVKPQINESGIVALEVSQEVSDYSTQTILGTTQYVFSKREAATNLVAKDGQTIVIGGLIQDNLTKSRSGIPFLSSIPILGYLFGSNQKSASKTEIIVLLTPHVIKNQQEAGSVTTGYLNRLKGEVKDINIDEFIKSGEQKKHDTGDSGNKEPSKSTP